MSLLSNEQRVFWEENGYVIIPKIVPQTHLDTTIEAIAAFLDIDPDDSETWYADDPPRRLGFVEMFHHQTLWDNRQHPKVHEIFKDLWNEEKLWVSFDRANMTPPERQDAAHGFHEPLIHWDFEASLHPDRLMMQGVLYLTNTEENQGGFQCVPGFHRQFQDWVKTQPLDRDPARPDMAGLTVKNVAASAGDLLVWHSLLPHGNSQNTSDKPRWCQYILMTPAEEDNEMVRQQRMRMWQDSLTPSDFPGDPRGREQQDGKQAELTPLGRKLLGLDRWT
jgi:hypothetical protein